LKGAGFSPYIKSAKPVETLLAAEKLTVLKGHGFSRASSVIKSAGVYSLRNNFVLCQGTTLVVPQAYKIDVGL
jgi:hypothetical protein